MALSPEVMAAWGRINRGVASQEDLRLCKNFYKPDYEAFETPTATWHYNGVPLKLAPGFQLNSDFARVDKVTLMIRDRTGGNCPCVPNTTWGDDTLCPCKYYREGNGCHCGLYVREG